MMFVVNCNVDDVNDDYDYSDDKVEDGKKEVAQRQVWWQ